MAGKTIVSTTIDEGTLQRLDAFCANVKKTRAEVLRGLLHALLVEGKQNIFDEWREKISPCTIEPTRKSKVLCALRRFYPSGMRARSVARVLTEDMSRSSVYRTLTELCKSGEAEETLGHPQVSGVVNKYYRLSQKGLAVCPQD